MGKHQKRAAKNGLEAIAWTWPRIDDNRALPNSTNQALKFIVAALEQWPLRLNVTGQGDCKRLTLFALQNFQNKCPAGRQSSSKGGTLCVLVPNTHNKPHKPLDQTV